MSENQLAGRVLCQWRRVHAGRTIEDALQVLDSNYRHYRMLERTLLQSKARLMGKLPEIQKAEEAVDLLIRKRESSEDVCIITTNRESIHCINAHNLVTMCALALQTIVDFAISDQAYAKAKVPITNHVNLWLGANVMLEYTLEDAKSLLVSQFYNDLCVLICAVYLLDTCMLYRLKMYRTAREISSRIKKILSF